MPFDLAAIVPGQPVKGRHIADLYKSLTGTLADQPITLGNNLTVFGTLTVGGVPMALVSQAQWDALVARVTVLESTASFSVDAPLRAYVQQIMAVLDPGGPPPP